MSGVKTYSKFYLEQILFEKFFEILTFEKNNCFLSFDTYCMVRYKCVSIKYWPFSYHVYWVFLISIILFYLKFFLKSLYGKVMCMATSDFLKSILVLVTY